ncbi:DUF2071 domain-containing protein [Verrucomicrobiales bacterium]|nr:DUF2071 domain-containing protein [Verrucomicrobiales bacterium]MDC0276506.1 DUF2071 domain-containing protein [Verrucomicrobiales bacterium]MDC0312006.1 DUF2071 domain-containing protein [bacterium]MDC0322022.1 DUF2071 domain-containing protein [Verrucomicrobiales bacterium]
MKTPTESQRQQPREWPDGEKPVMFQTWSDLLFLHWRVAAADLQKLLPEGLFIDTFGDSAWIGIVPFKMQNIRPRGLFPVPWISYFLELNVRTYVHDRDGNPGVWFFSLDTNRWLAYKIARTFFKLPYFPARMSADRRDDGFLDYRCRRNGVDGGESTFIYRAEDPETAPELAEPGTLDFFLLERYLLFSHDPKSGKLFSGQVNHTPYQFKAASVDAWDTKPAQWDEMPELIGNPDHVAVAESVDVSVFALKSLM